MNNLSDILARSGPPPNYVGVMEWKMQWVSSTDCQFHQSSSTFVLSCVSGRHGYDCLPPDSRARFRRQWNVSRIYWFHDVKLVCTVFRLLVLCSSLPLFWGKRINERRTSGYFATYTSPTSNYSHHPLSTLLSSVLVPVLFVGWQQIPR